MRAPASRGPCTLSVCLLLVAVLGRGARALLWTQNIYTRDFFYRPLRPKGDQFPVTTMTHIDLRWTFEGLDYDYPSLNHHQVVTDKAKSYMWTCVGEYTRCLLRESKPAEVCGYDRYTNYYYKFYTICDIEYQNCKSLREYDFVNHDYFHPSMHRFIYDGEGWIQNYGTDWSWYCYLNDQQFGKLNLRRVLSRYVPSKLKTIARSIF